jgi:hypothetical protein
MDLTPAERPPEPQRQDQKGQPISKSDEKPRVRRASVAPSGCAVFKRW